MLNYIWAGLIITSLLFAMVTDIGELASDRYRNDDPLPVELAFPEGYDPGARRVAVRIRLDSANYAAFYRTAAQPAGEYAGYLLQTREGVQLRFEAGAALPQPLATIAQVSKSRDDELQGRLVGFERPAVPGAPGAPATGPPGVEGVPVVEAGVVFEPVRFVKVNAIAAAALDFAETAATIALGLIGVLALFLGLLRIAEDAGVVQALVRLVRPVLRPLFPEIPEDHPALGMIGLNLAANMFGLGNAATPFGIRAMEELQKLNPTTDTATNPMVMLLAMNTASVQLVPPVLLVALMGLQVNELIIPIITTTILSLIVAIAAAKLYGRLPRVRATDPNRNPPPGATPSSAAAGE